MNFSTVPPKRSISLPQAGVVGPDARADVLGVGGLGGGREPDQVAEEDGHDLALLERRRRRGDGERRAALQAELRPLGILLAASRTRRHGTSLRLPFRGG